MMNTTTNSIALSTWQPGFVDQARIFPIKPDTKRPAFVGWQAAATSDRQQLAEWSQQFPGCAWAIACAESGLIGVEIDPKARKVAKDPDSERAGRDRAWAAWHDLRVSWGLPNIAPHVNSRSEGWHFYFQPKPTIDLRKKINGRYELSQRGLVKLPGFDQHVIETRVNGFMLVPPSTFEGRAYSWFPDTSDVPYDAPQQLIDALRNTIAQEAGAQPNPIIKPGSHDLRALAKYICKVHHQVGLPRDVWRAAIFALVAQFGDYVAYQVAQTIHDGQPHTTAQIDDLIGRARKTFEPGDSTLKTLFKHAHEHGIRDVVPLSLEATFGLPAQPLDIDKILAEIDAEKTTLQPPNVSALPQPSALPMLTGTKSVVDIGVPIVAAFNAAQAIEHDIRADTLLPIEMNAAELRSPLTEAIGKILTLATRQRAALQSDFVCPVLAVLSAAHAPTFDVVVNMIRATGAKITDGRLKSAVQSFEADVQRAARTGQGWITDSKGYPDPKISENVDVLLSILGVQLRFNIFSQRIEFQRNSERWAALEEERDLTSILYEANSAAHRFHVSYTNLRSNVMAIARRRTYDPLTDWLDSLRWDRVARLDSWLSHAIGVPPDAYHVAVGRNLIGGLVKRARHPGSKHDEVVLLMGKQGHVKSGMARALMPDPEWFSETLNIRQRSQDLIPEIAGKWLVEWSELAGKGKAELEDIKSFLSRGTDRFTAKFEKIAADHPRRAIFLATTNADAPLRDETGNRRFLPMRVAGEINVTWIEANRDMLFAEASALEADGEKFGIPRHLWETASEHQEAAREQAIHEILIGEWFGERKGTYYVTSGDLLAALQRRGVKTNSIGAACERVGLEKRRTNRIQNFWITKGADEKTTPRLKLADLGYSDAHSKVRWDLQVAPPPSSTPSTSACEQRI